MLRDDKSSHQEKRKKQDYHRSYWDDSDHDKGDYRKPNSTKRAGTSHRQMWVGEDFYRSSWK